MFSESDWVALEKVVFSVSVDNYHGGSVVVKGNKMGCAEVLDIC